MRGQAPQSGDFNALVKAIKINENTEQLSRPNILVMGRERGDVTVGQNVPSLSTTEATDGGNMIQQIQLSCGVLSRSERTERVDKELRIVIKTTLL
ncbi:hypothetical protein ACFFUP_06510 [Vibrio ostreicida]|uniref:Uncharacterized protein n=1 Tax=Vibrio ostreicida TaxID=526588 RepID=A0ABT8BRP0_9VIBR|nr:hypothetical protein [Vibrio ostreicida]MDN3609373.1 hypothetical protein [Vibrio ostreicida]